MIKSVSGTGLVSKVGPGGPGATLGRKIVIVIAFSISNLAPQLLSSLMNLRKGKPKSESPERITIHTKAEIEDVLTCVKNVIGPSGWFVQDYRTSHCYGDVSLRTEKDRPCRGVVGR